MFSFLLTMTGVLLGALAASVVFLLLRKGAKRAPERITIAAVAERVRAVGKLVGLEVHAKEIATSVKGWGWLPPILLSQARLAVIFHFEKQYWTDLTKVRAADVEETGRDAASGRVRFRLRLPAVEGSLRLLDVEPYDIQAGRVLGLLDVIQMDAPTQKDLIKRAQEQASGLFTMNEERYVREARASVERQMSALLGLFGVDAEIEWAEAARSAGAQGMTIQGGAVGSGGGAGRA